MGERLRERWEFCFWKRENERNGRGKKNIKKKEILFYWKLGIKIIITFSFELPCTYIYCCKYLKIFKYSSTTLFLYFDVTKMAI